MSNLGDAQATTQAVLVSQAAVDPEQALERIALFDESGDPVENLESVSGADVVLTGYEAGDPDPVAATDTINEAIAKVEAQAGVDPTGADVVLTGYTSTDPDDVAATDSVNDAIAKLEARVAALEAPA